MAAGKSTLSKELAAREDAVHLTQDGLLEACIPVNSSTLPPS
jgi:adenylate kinase family enzyme